MGGVFFTPPIHFFDEYFVVFDLLHRDGEAIAPMPDESFTPTACARPRNTE
jgi:hypothetical protein